MSPPPPPIQRRKKDLKKKKSDDPNADPEAEGEEEEEVEVEGEEPGADVEDEAVAVRNPEPIPNEGQPDHTNTDADGNAKSNQSEVSSGGTSGAGTPGTAFSMASKSVLADCEKLMKTPLPPRPDVGKKGRKVGLAANFYPIQIAPNTVVQKYNVDIIHPIKDRRLSKDETRLIFWSALKEHKLVGNPYMVAYDGQHLMYSTEMLKLKGGWKHQEVEVKVPLERDPRRETDCRVDFQHTGSIHLNDLKASRVSSDPSVLSANAIQAIDVIFRQNLSCPILKPAQDFYTHKNSIFPIPKPGQSLDLGPGSEMWTGFHSSAILCAGDRALLNCDVAHSAFFKTGNSFLQLCSQILSSGGGGGGGRGGRGGGPMRGGGRGGFNGGAAGSGPLNLSTLTENSSLTEGQIKTVNTWLKGKGVRVRTTHMQDYRKSYKPFALTTQPATKINFSLDSHDGNPPQEVSVAEYFNNKYFRLRLPQMPCLQVAPAKKEMFIPLEVLELEAPNKFNAKLSDDAVSNMIRQTAVPADERRKKIQNLAGMAGFGQDPFLRSFGLALSSKMVEFSARVLDAPPIQYKGTGPRSVAMPRDGAWKTDGVQLLLPPGGEHAFKEYSLIALANPQRDERALVGFCTELHKTAAKMGWQIPEGPRIVRYGRCATDIELLYDEIVQTYTDNHVRCDLVFIVMPGKDSHTYTTCKHASDMKHGVMSQCLLMKTVLKPVPATCMNILFKLCAKLRGIPHCPQPSEPMKKYIFKQTTMVMGIDVTHPTMQEVDENMPSIAAVVASVDPYAMTYSSSIKIQKRSQENIIYLVDCMRERLVSYFRATQTQPDRIIVFRDGVAEGQFESVMKEEISGLRRACKNLHDNYDPKITYVIVQKRHHTRLFATNPRDECGRAKNIPPGTVVDTDIVSPNAYDYFLCSHFGIQGTSRPAKYFVLADDNQMKADELQAITYSLCHNFVRCPRAVSIPAPAYYADLVATRARLHVKAYLKISSSGSMSSRGGEKGSKASDKDSKSSETESEGTDGDSSTATSSSIDEAVRLSPDMAERMYFV